MKQVGGIGGRPYLSKRSRLRPISWFFVSSARSLFRTRTATNGNSMSSFPTREQLIDLSGLCKW